MDVCLSPQDRPFISDIRFRGSTGFFVRSGMPVFASSDSSDCGSVRGWERNRSARAERSISEVRYKTDNCKWEAQDTSGHTTLLCSPAFRRIADVFLVAKTYIPVPSAVFLLLSLFLSLFLPTFNPVKSQNIFGIWKKIYLNLKTGRNWS